MFFVVVVFVWFVGGWGGGGGCISIHEKDTGLRQHSINVLVYYILFFHFLQL